MRVPGVVLEEDLRLAGADHVEAVAGLAVVEEDLALGDLHLFELGGQRDALVLVEEVEERDLGQESGVGRHSTLQGTRHCKRRGGIIPDRSMARAR